MSTLKLHVGCGDKIISGYRNIDARALPGVDEVGDITTLTHYAENSVDLIYACHVLEHTGRYAYRDVLKRWFALLKPGGLLRLAVPDFEAVCTHYTQHKDLNVIMGLLYGGQTYAQNFHYVTFDFEHIKTDLLALGFQTVNRYDRWATEHAHIDDFSAAYLPHMDRNGQLMSLNIEAVK
ncbi:MAG: class I SAM-dependent methyltransferase [Chitinophagaceae bacterium]